MPTEEDVSPATANSTPPQLVSEEAVNYEMLDGLFGEVYRKNHEVMSLAFALSNDRMHQRILWHLARTGPKTSMELHSLTKISKGKISKIVAELHEAGIIEKSQGPRGSEPLSISAGFKRDFFEHSEHVLRLLQSAFSVLSKEEQHNLHSMLKRVLDRLNAIHCELIAKPSSYIEVERKNDSLPALIDKQENRSGRDYRETVNEQSRADTTNTQQKLNATFIEKQMRVVIEISEKFMKFES